MSVKVKYITASVIDESQQSEFEAKVNNWLESNQTYQIIDIKLTETMIAPSDQNVISYATALIIYRTR